MWRDGRDLPENAHFFPNAMIKKAKWLFTVTQQRREAR